MRPGTGRADRSIVWDAIDDHVVRATFTNAGHSVHANVEFNAAGELTDFQSDDRMASIDGKTMTAMRWSTPLTAYRSFGGVRLGSRGEGRWHAAAGEFACIEIEIDEIDYNVSRRDR